MEYLSEIGAPIIQAIQIPNVVTVGPLVSRRVAAGYPLMHRVPEVSFNTYETDSRVGGTTLGPGFPYIGYRGAYGFW